VLARPLARRSPADAVANHGTGGGGEGGEILIGEGAEQLVRESEHSLLWRQASETLLWRQASKTLLWRQASKTLLWRQASKTLLWRQTRNNLLDDLVVAL
jgi:hypothetical protein